VFPRDLFSGKIRLEPLPGDDLMAHWDQNMAEPAAPRRAYLIVHADKMAARQLAAQRSAFIRAMSMGRRNSAIRE
jgi:hypothetical protein